MWWQMNMYLMTNLVLLKVIVHAMLTDIVHTFIVHVHVIVHTLFMLMFMPLFTIHVIIHHICEQ